MSYWDVNTAHVFRLLMQRDGKQMTATEAMLREQMPLRPSPELEEFKRKIKELSDEMVETWVQHVHNKMFVIPALCGPMGRMIP